MGPDWNDIFTAFMEASNACSDNEDVNKYIRALYAIHNRQS